MKQLYRSVLLLLLFLGACVPGIIATPSASIGNISGTVIDSSNGSPIPAANVNTDPPTSSVTTDAQGNYAIPDVPPGNYTVSASKSGYTSASVRVAVTENISTTADVHLIAGLVDVPISPTPTDTPISPTPTNAPISPTPGNAEYALRFDGNDWVAIGDKDALEFGTSDFTISVWLKTNRQGRQQQIIRKGYDEKRAAEGRWVLSIAQTGVIRIVINDVEYPQNLVSLGNTVITDGQWHHVAAVFDRDEALRVYVDGELEIQDSNLVKYAASIHNTRTVNVYIGRANSSGYYFEGLIGQISVWEIARSQQEIQTDMNHHLAGTETGLIAYWRMDKGQGQIISDHAGNNHGQLGSSSGTDTNDPTWEQSFPH